jgi:hypothetical protein
MMTIRPFAALTFLTLFTMLAVVVAVAMPSPAIARPQQDDSADSSEAKDEPADQGESTEEPAEPEEKPKKRKRGMRSTGTVTEPAEKPATTTSDGKKRRGMRSTGITPATSQALALGDFLVRVVGALQLPPPQGGFKHESAAFALRGKGIEIRNEMGSSVTEADVVAILNGLGYRVRTTTPSRVLDQARSDLLIATFIPEKG